MKTEQPRLQSGLPFQRGAASVSIPHLGPAKQTHLEKETWLGFQTSCLRKGASPSASLSRMVILDYGHFQPFLQIGRISPLPCVSKPSETGDEKPTVAWEFRSEPAVERRWTVTERGEDLKQARQEGEACIWALPLQFLITSSSDTGAHVRHGSYTMPSYGGAWRRYPFVPPPPIFKLENFVPGCWAWPAFSLKGKVFGGDVCVRLSRLLAVEPGDNEDYLTETNIDKWSTFLNSFQSTNFYFLSFSGAPRNL